MAMAVAVAVAVENKKKVVFSVRKMLGLQDTFRLHKTTATQCNNDSLMNIRTLYNQRVELKEALPILEVTGNSMDDFTYARLLQGCVKQKALPEGKILHAHIIQTGFQCPDMVLDNILVNMYAKCQRLVDARRAFDQMPKQNVVSWTAMIAGYAQNGFNEEALALFDQMKETSLEPNHFTFASVLPACANLVALERGKEIHDEIIRRGLQGNLFMGNAIIDMYGKCGSLENARNVFDKMPERDLVSWNSMITGYAQNGLLDEALGLFNRVPKRNVITWTTVIAGYAQNGGVDEALKLFNTMPERDVASWNAMIAGYAQNGRVEESLELFRKMLLQGMKPNSKTFTVVIPACAQLAALGQGKEIHEDIIRRGFQFDVFVESALIDMYTKCEAIENARLVFEKMPERDVVAWNAMVAGYARNGYVDEALKLFQIMPTRDAVSWNLMLSGYAEHGHVVEALELFQRMPKPDAVSWNAMIAGYVQDGCVQGALNLFQRMPARDVVSWNVMIAGYAENGYGEDALKLFQQMQLIDMKPNVETLTIILPICANMAALEHGKEVHEVILRNGFQSVVVMGNTLIDMYAKCGNIENAFRVFYKMPQQDVISWTSMIVSYAMHGFGTEALQLFEQMQQSGIIPNQITFVGVLCACCHTGLVNQGWQYFKSMNQYYNITPTMEHYGCMVDLFSRSGFLDEAKDFINDMPIEPASTVWGPLLSACRKHNNIELGEHVAECLFQLDPENPGPYVLLSNIYAAAGRWDDIAKVRKMMKDRGIKKTAGCSWIEINKEVHAFIVGN